MLLSVPALLPPDTPGQRWFDKSRGAWTVISYMYVLEVHTGATLKVGFFRLAGTFIGPLFGFIVSGPARTIDETVTDTRCSLRSLQRIILMHL